MYWHFPSWEISPFLELDWLDQQGQLYLCVPTSFPFYGDAKRLPYWGHKCRACIPPTWPTALHRWFPAPPFTNLGSFGPKFGKAMSLWDLAKHTGTCSKWCLVLRPMVAFGVTFPCKLPVGLISSQKSAWRRQTKGSNRQFPELKRKKK